MKTTEPIARGEEVAADSEPRNDAVAETTEPIPNEWDDQEAHISAKFYYWVLSRL